MRRLLFALMAFLATSLPAPAQVKVAGKTSYAVNEPIVLKADNIVTDTAQLVWLIQGRGVRSIKDRDKCYVWALPGEYQVTLVAGYNRPDGKLVLEQADHTFTVGGKAAPAKPAPTTAPTKAPALFAKFSDAHAESLRSGKPLVVWVGGNFCPS